MPPVGNGKNAPPTSRTDDRFSAASVALTVLAKRLSPPLWPSDVDHRQLVLRAAASEAGITSDASGSHPARVRRSVGGRGSAAEQSSPTVAESPPAAEAEAANGLELITR